MMERVRWFTILTVIIAAVTTLLYAVDKITFEDAIVYLGGALVLSVVGAREP